MGRRKIKQVSEKSYRIDYQQTVDRGESKGITCLYCMKTSFNEFDVRFKYCPTCKHIFKDKE